MTKKKRKPRTEVSKKFTEKLPCKLADEEIRHRGEELARRYSELDKIESELQTAKEIAKGKRKPVEERMSDLTRQINSRSEDRQVECVERIDWRRNCAEVFRQDTKERVRTRPLTIEERQMKLDVANRKRKTPAKKATPKKKVAAKKPPKGKPDLKAVAGGKSPAKPAVPAPPQI